VSDWLESLSDERLVAPDEIAALRHDLELAASDALAAVGTDLDGDQRPLRLPKGRLADLARCERSALARHRLPEQGPPGDAALLGSALDLFVAHQLVVGRVREPLADLVAMLDAAADHDALDAVAQVDASRLESELAPLATAVAAGWSGIDPGWAPRTQSRATAVLAGGDVVCAGVLDVELGGPGTGRPGAVVEVKSGEPSSTHPHEVYLYALLVSLRDRAAPAVVARWHPGGDPAALTVTLGVLEAAAARLIQGIRTWAALLSGAVPDERPGGWCAWCPDRPRCPSAADRDDVADREVDRERHRGEHRG
jgi:hypothetical protein